MKWNFSYCANTWPLFRLILPLFTSDSSSNYLSTIFPSINESANSYRRRNKYLTIYHTKEGFHSFLNKETSPSPTDRLAECWFLPINTIVIPPMFLSRRRISLSTPLECFQPFAKPKKPPAKVIHSFHFRIINLLFTTYIFIYIQIFAISRIIHFKRNIFKNDNERFSFSLFLYTHPLFKEESSDSSI